jgi:arylsulfatase A-like enzyme
VAYTDRWNGQLLSALRAMGLSRNTLVVFTADHGESLGEHEYYFEHGLFTYDASARIPLIMSLPGLVDEGRRDDQVVESVDILPTILDLIGAEVPSSCQGGSCAGRVARSLAGRLSWDGEMLRPAGRGKGYAYIEAGYGHHSGPGYTFAMTDGRYKLIIRDAAWVLRPRNLLWYMYSVNTLFEGGAGAPELYDLVADPGERVNVYGRRPAEKVLLSGDLRDFMKKTRDAGTMQRQPGEKALDEQTVRALRALGYVH